MRAISNYFFLSKISDCFFFVDDDDEKTKHWMFEFMGELTVLNGLRINIVVHYNGNGLSQNSMVGQALLLYMWLSSKF